MRDKALGHYTHEKNPVACAAGLATIEVIEKEGLLENARLSGGYALQQMRGWMDRNETIGDVRGLGLLMGIELVVDRKRMDRALDSAEWMMYRALSKGLNFKLTMGNILTLTPALTITREEMDEALSILNDCFSELSSTHL